MIVEHWWNDTDRGTPKYWQGNMSQCHFFFHHRSHTDWCRIVGIAGHMTRMVGSRYCEWRGDCRALPVPTGTVNGGAHTRLWMFSCLPGMQRCFLLTVQVVLTLYSYINSWRRFGGTSHYLIQFLIGCVFGCIEITNKMRPCSRIYYSSVSWLLNMFRATHRPSSGAQKL